MLAAPEPGCAADTAGAASDLGAIYTQTMAACTRFANASLRYAARRLPRAFHVSQAAAHSLLAARCAAVPFALDACQRRS
jgi:hypothetical protein